MKPDGAWAAQPSSPVAAPDASGSGWLHRLASLRLTLALLAALALTVVAVYLTSAVAPWVVAVPLGLGAANLAAAIATHPALRRSLPLLVFHVALLAVILLAGAGRLTYLKGQLELAEGESFDGSLSAVDAGPWHRGALDELRFTNGGFTIVYARGVKRGRTRNTVHYRDETGRSRSAVIGDTDPLVLSGYRFYTSHNKGFAPMFLWLPRGGEAQLGSVHLPSYPLNEYRQSQRWTPPGSSVPVWVMLQFDEVILDPERPSEFRLPGSHALVLRVDERRYELQPGQGVDLPQGRLEYAGLRAWMGYNVHHDWTLPWLLAACLVAAASLGGYFWQRFAARPWDA